MISSPSGSSIFNNNSIIKPGRAALQPKCRFPRRTKAKDMEADQLQARREYERVRRVEVSLREQERNSMKNEDLYAQNIRFEEKSEAEKAKLESALSQPSHF